MIAEKTGFSINTVSHALRGLPDISADTAKLIQDTADKMGYIRNAAASTMRSGSSGIIAVIIGDIANPLFSMLLSDLDNLLSQKGYCTAIFSTVAGLAAADVATGDFYGTVSGVNSTAVFTCHVRETPNVA